jgi:iron-sulfur cluster repair protein YtfE (RIC family)
MNTRNHYSEMALELKDHITKFNKKLQPKIENKTILDSATEYLMLREEANELDQSLNRMFNNTK